MRQCPRSAIDQSADHRERQDEFDCIRHSITIGVEV
jgi:hypothetical protein